MTTLATLDIKKVGSGKPHGTRLRYLSGCKCLLCRAANANYNRKREALNKAGHGDPFVSTDKVCAHISALSKNGIGRKTIADVTGLAQSTIRKYMTGDAKFIRKSNEQKILNVDVSCAADGAYISARETKFRINWLLNEGFTKKEIALRLGYKSPALQFNFKRITAANAAKIERLYNQMRLGDE